MTNCILSLNGYGLSSMIALVYNIFIPHMHKGKAISLSVIVGSGGMKIARSRVVGIYACCKHNPSVDIDEKKLVSKHFKWLKMAC